MAYRPTEKTAGSILIAAVSAVGRSSSFLRSQFSTPYSVAFAGFWKGGAEMARAEREPMCGLGLCPRRGGGAIKAGSCLNIQRKNLN